MPIGPREQRRLAAVLSSDVVGYSKLMERDEAGTLAALKADRRAIFDPKASQHRGRTVKLMGDGALMEFGSVVDAVRFAVELQCAIRERNVGLPDDACIRYRIGINIGDIVVDGDDIHGDSVNIAARLQALAEPGGILLARSAYNQVKGKLDLTLEHVGEKAVKNIAEPLSVYRIALDDRARALVTPAATVRPRIGYRWLAGGMAFALVAAAALIWMQPWQAGFSPDVGHTARPLPAKPSLAVLPFSNLGDDPQQGYFADGMAEDLITDLSHISGIFVIARNSSWAYRDKPAKVQQIAEELGVRYVVEGSVRRDGELIRINAQLIDALSGYHVWAERYDGAAADVFKLQDKVIGSIVDALAVSLTHDESTQLAAPETASPKAYDLFLQGWNQYRTETVDGNGKAIALFEQAAQVDPGYARVYAALGAAYWRIVTSGWQSAAGIEWERSYQELHENLAIALGNPTALAFSVSAEVLARQGQHQEALAQIERALALVPNDPEANVSKARILSAVGRAEDAERAVRLAMQVDPLYGPDTLSVLGRALLHQERYAEAAEVFEQVVQRQPDRSQDYVSLVVANGHLGRGDKAAAALDAYNRICAKGGFQPLTVEEVGYWWYGNIFEYDEVYRERLREGLRAAGVPEGAGTDVGYAELKRMVSDRAGEYGVAGAATIDAATAKRLHDQGAVFVDVRQPPHFAGGHIPTATNLDLSHELAKDTLAAVAKSDEEIVFSCFGKYCPYAAFASAKAVKWGYSRVNYFAGGFPAWKAAGYPVETGPHGGS